MKNIISKTAFVAIVASAIISCKPDLKAPTAEKGSADFTKYVAIGNSITAGFADGALYYDGQASSYANILAQQFKTVGGGEFKTPFTAVNSVGMGSSGNAKLVLGYKTDCKGVNGLSPIPFAANGDLAVFFASVANQQPFNNMGIPGAKVTTVVYPGYGNAALLLPNYNPFFARTLTTAEQPTASMLSKSVEQNATFFSLFIGNNDVLGYSTDGGASGSITPSAGAAGVGFDASYDAIIAGMTANGAKGVIANVPYVNDLPYFTTVPYNGLTLDATQAAGLSAYYNAVYPTAGISFSAGSGLPFIIQDPAVTGGVRKIKSNEYVLLTTPQDSLKCAGWGSKKPLANKYVLTEAEVANIKNATDAYNTKIKTVADAKGFAFVDVNAFMASAKKGVVFNAVTTSATFVSGGAFSLDGIHLTPRGNALLANEFIKAINAKFGSTIMQVDANQYIGIKFP